MSEHLLEVKHLKKSYPVYDNSGKLFAKKKLYPQRHNASLRLPSAMATPFCPQVFALELYIEFQSISELNTKEQVSPVPLYLARERFELSTSRV